MRTRNPFPTAEKRAKRAPNRLPDGSPKGEVMEVIHDFDPKTNAIIRRTAAWLKTLAAFAGMEAEDVEQEVALRLCVKLKSYDPARYVYHKFVNVAMGSIKSDMIRAMSTENEVGRRNLTVSLDQIQATGDDGEPLTAADIIQDKRPPLDDEVAFSADLEALLSTLSGEMRQAAHLLVDRTINEVAEEMNMPVTTFRRRIYEPLREALASFRRKRASA